MPVHNNITYHLYYPGGNTTALVENYTGLDKASVAAHIMADNPIVEQVGFLQEPVLQNTDLHLEMMGGEFCGNAARCAVLHHAAKTKKNQVMLSVSGFSTPIVGTVANNVVCLRLPGNFLIAVQHNNNWVVDFHGIRFIVIDRLLTEHELHMLIKEMRQGFPAVGVIFLQQNMGQYYITPTIWVNATQTLISETACASGSLAAAVVLLEQASSQAIPLHVSITQPSGQVYDISVAGQAAREGWFTLSGSVIAYVLDKK